MDYQTFATTMIDLNNIGVMHMESGCFSDAIQSFALSLRILEQMIHFHLTTRPTQNGKATRFDYSCAPMQTPSQDPLFDASATYTVVSGEKKDDGAAFTRQNHVYIFRSPVYFAEGMDHQSLPLEKLSVSLLFNVALSHHAIALYEQTSTSTIEAALFHYQLAYTLQLQDGIELGHLHTLGIISNVSQLLAQMGDKDGSQKWADLLLCKLMLHIDQSRIRNYDDRIGTQLEGFVGNILQAFSPLMSTAPAA